MVLFFVVLPVAVAYQSGRIGLFVPALLVLVSVQWTVVGDNKGTSVAGLVLAVIGLAGASYASELGIRRRQLRR
jgi:nitrate/nitrite transporter NarK